VGHTSEKIAKKKLSGGESDPGFQRGGVICTGERVEHYRREKTSKKKKGNREEGSMGVNFGRRLKKKTGLYWAEGNWKTKPPNPHW